MNEEKQIYQDLHTAIENNEMEKIVSLLTEIDALLQHPSLTNEEKRWMVTQSEICFENIQKKYDTLQHLLLDMNFQNKIAKKYEQD